MVSDQEEALDRSVAVVVPVKSFDLAKGRLSDALSTTERSALARRMATGVLAAAKPLSRWVVCDNGEVAAWATAEGAGVIWCEVDGLNEAVTAAVEFLAEKGFERAVVAHGDLPLARDLSWVGEFDGVTIVPDRRGLGTNVMAVPTKAGFVFVYGEGSAPKHEAEANRLGLAVRIVPDDQLGWDVDTPEDLAVFDLTEPLTPPDEESPI